MTGKIKTDATWHSTSVILRSDIYRKALEQGIDISDTCNRALASLTGSEYYSRQMDEVPTPPPVIIAKDGSSPYAPKEKEKSPLQKLHPVINADDPAAPAKVVQAKIKPTKKAPAEPPAPVPAPAPVIPEEEPIAAPAATTKKAAVKKSQTASTKKRSKGDALRTFFSTHIARSDEEEDRVGKDELYERFARFCRDHRITPVPERKTVTVALKNQFALTEKLVDGTSCWTGIRLK
jgi:hypothetical protein